MTCPDKVIATKLKDIASNVAAFLQIYNVARMAYSELLSDDYEMQTGLNAAIEFEFVYRKANHDVVVKMTPKVVDLWLGYAFVKTEEFTIFANSKLFYFYQDAIVKTDHPNKNTTNINNVDYAKPSYLNGELMKVDAHEKIIPDYIIAEMENRNEIENVDENFWTHAFGEEATPAHVINHDL
jgi:hypothetical protein